MSAYYNEFDPYNAQWLRNLIEAGHIAPGIVDERSIEDVHPGDLHGFTQCHFFAGIGVWSLALRRAGWPDDRPVWTGSCPCQPFSKAGEGLGFADERHLWPAWHHLISQRKPPELLGEQVPDAIKKGWLDLVRDDLEASNYAFGAIRFGSDSTGGQSKGSVSTLLPSISAREWRDRSQALILARLDRGDGVAKRICSLSPALRLSKEIVGLNPCFGLWLMGLPQTWARCMPSETPSTLKRRRNS